MKRIFLILFIVVDIAVMGAAAYILFIHLTGKETAPTAVSSNSAPTSSGLLTSTSTVGALGLVTSTGTVPGQMARPLSGGPSDSAVRKILFTYRNPKARTVAIRADFTGWKGESMVRDTRGVWTFQASLPPGEYAYCYTVDNKSIRDPANPRRKPIGRTYVSAIVVTPLAR
jgi:hypothetical protein